MFRFAALIAVLGCASWLHPAGAAHAQVGTQVEDAELDVAGGGRMRLLAPSEVNVLLFVRPGQERSRIALRELQPCLAKRAGKPVRWVAVVSGSYPPERIAELAKEAVPAAPFLVDAGDEVYGRLGVALHPVVIVVDASKRLAAFEAFRELNYCAVVTARIRHALREISDDELQQALAPPKAAEGGDGQVALRYRALAEAQFKAGSHEKALDSVRKSLEKNGRLVSAHGLMGDILAAQGKCADAGHAYGRALEIDPAYAPALDGLARCKR